MQHGCQKKHGLGGCDEFDRAHQSPSYQQWSDGIHQRVAVDFKKAEVEVMRQIYQDELERLKSKSQQRRKEAKDASILEESRASGSDAKRKREIVEAITTVSSRSASPCSPERGSKAGESRDKSRDESEQPVRRKAAVKTQPKPIRIANPTLPRAPPQLREKEKQRLKQRPRSPSRSRSVGRGPQTDDVSNITLDQAYNVTRRLSQART